MIKKIILSLLVAGAVASASAQQNMTLYQMHEIVQSNSLNPAVPGTCRWTIGIPLLGSVSLAASAPVSYNDLGAGQTTIDADDLLSKIKNTNVFSANGNVNLIMVGYRTDRNYFQFTVNERFNTIGSVNKDPLELLLKGNGRFVGQTVEATPGLTGIYYREYGISAAHDFGSDLWAGARAKLLFGRLGISSTANSASLYTEPGTYDLTLTSDLLVRASIPGKAVLRPDGTVEDFDTDIKTSDLLFNPSNVGAALDLGVTKTTESGWKLSASVLNIGMVSWSKNVHTFRQNSTMKYTGPTPAITNWTDLVDTLKSVIKVKEFDEGGYTQWLAPVFMAGASYPVAEYFRLGLTGMAEYQSASIPWAITATAFTEGFEHITAGLSYTVTQSSFVNVGMGVGLRFGAFNIHMLTDNIIAAFSPFGQRYATVQFGINLRFGCDGLGSSSSGKRPCAAFRDALDSGRKIEDVPCPDFGRKRKGVR